MSLKATHYPRYTGNRFTFLPMVFQEMSLYVLDWDPYNLHSPFINPTKRCQPDTLSALNISTTISNVEHVKCFVQDPTTKEERNSYQGAYNMALAVKRTSRFVDRLIHGYGRNISCMGSVLCYGAAWQQTHR